MTNPQRTKLAQIDELNPRGVNTGTTLSYISHTHGQLHFTVGALQKWHIAGGSATIGLVWVGVCPTCKTRWAQMSSSRPQVLHEVCHKCRGEEPLFDAAVLQPAVDAVPIGGKKRGRIETHILEVMTLFGERDIVPMAEVVNEAAKRLPAPQEGQRDTRRQLVIRALQQLGKEKDGPLAIHGGNVIFYE